MNNPTAQQAKERFNSLPKVLQDAIFSIESADSIRKISDKHQLRVDQVGELADEVGLMMMGFTRQNQFSPNLVERLQVTKEKADLISVDIEKEIFSEIRAALKGREPVPSNLPTGARRDEENPSETNTRPVSIPDPIPTVPSTSPSFSPPTPATPPVTTQTSLPEQKLSQNVQSERKETHFEEHSKEKTRPFSEDPYREPIE